ncbi:unnamed protein product [Spirodela intermedia]|uniref:Uncharacterized protein n=1 Tax=Spirodela intermedia TaxID=51605 RepID=A0A7I8JS67_SPIIN|nr:unnamed protein product [Spirodela intermedia]CAA6673026.1 unnamed protein product [Spirodela intermedia]
MERAYLICLWAQKEGRLMKWVVESSPTAVTQRNGKTATCGSPVAITRRKGARWRWRLVSRRIVLFLTTACSSINQR